MDILFLCIVIFLFILAVFDLSVGVSNDAVNFLTSAIGSKAARFRTVVLIAAVGVFAGAAMSNGMMDIARHGIFRPEHFSFYDLICIFMAVMVTDIILLDVFNSLGMPTSTTVSMVFELLGAAFVIALIKMWGDPGALGVSELLNTGKALSVILGIFLSVAIAFVFGTVVQFLARSIFTFEYRSRLKWKIGIFGGIATTAIIYFLLLKGVKDMVWMTPEIKGWIQDNTLLILGCCLAVFTLLMQLLHALGVNVLKVVVLIGTFALAMAFAGNDLVNFIGVPLSGFASWQDYMANGSGDPSSFMMDSLNGPANTPVYFLLGAGVIMVVSLATSKKARNVTRTEIGLGSQEGGDEMFGSSRIARRLVRLSLAIHSSVRRYMPEKLRLWIDRRFNTSEITLEQGASFDLIRGAVNLMLAGMLIALGTSMKLPLSTTFVTFMVAMGTSLADRAWGRESAVFRITGVISVIGGWFITAGVAFIGAALIAALMHWGGFAVMIVAGVVAVILIVRSNLRFKARKEEEQSDAMFQAILTCDDRDRTWPLLRTYIVHEERAFLDFAAATYGSVTEAFAGDDVKALGRADKALEKEKDLLKSIRRKQTLCLRRVPADTAIEKSAWFHMATNACSTMNYSLRRITEVCREHVENNFRPLPAGYREGFGRIRQGILSLMADASPLLEAGAVKKVSEVRRRGDRLKDEISAECHRIYDWLHSGAADNLTVTYVYLNMLQESQELVSALRKLLRAAAKLRTSEPVRPTPTVASSKGAIPESEAGIRS